jgi:hypothetical protein
MIITVKRRKRNTRSGEVKLVRVIRRYAVLYFIFQIVTQKTGYNQPGFWHALKRCQSMRKSISGAGRYCQLLHPQLSAHIIFAVWVGKAIAVQSNTMSQNLDAHCKRLLLE